MDTSESITTSSQAKRLMERFGIAIDESKIKLGNFGLIEGRTRNSLKCCFFYDYYGIIPPNKWWQIILRLFIKPKNKKRHVTIYVKAFHGKSERVAKMEQTEKTFFTTLYSDWCGFHSPTFGDWKYVNGEIVPFDKKKTAP